MGKLDIIKAAATGSPTDLLAEAASSIMAQTSGAKVEVEWKELAEEMILELQREWKDFKEREWPKVSDVRQGILRFCEAHRKTNNNKKRKILWNAFWNTFRPEFYNEGIANILWEKIEELEYPDFIFLRKLLEETDPGKRMVQRMEGWDSGGRGVWRGDQMPIRSSDEEVEYAERLSQQNLVDIEHSENGGVLYVSWKGLAAKLKKFALDEFEFYEAEKA